MLPIQVYETCPYPLQMVKCVGKQHESKKNSLNIFVKRLLSIIKKGEIESLSLVLDNWWNLCTNLCHELWNELGWCNPSVKHGGTQEKVLITWNDEMATCDDDQVLNLEKKKEKNKTLWRSRKGINRVLFRWSRHESVITFRVDSRTIKRGS